MGNFDKAVFVHALYVAFAYAMLAWGATAYRQVIDNLLVKEKKLGEDIFSCYDPTTIMWLGVLSVIWLIFFIGSVFIAPTAEVHIYVIPLALFINVLQFGYRIKHQKLQVKSLGLIGRNVFTERFEAVPYESIQHIGSEDKGWWNAISITYYCAEEKEERTFRRYILPNEEQRLVAHLQHQCPPGTTFGDIADLPPPIEKG